MDQCPEAHGVARAGNLAAVKDEVIRRWGTLDLLEVLKDADFLTEFSSEFTSVASREVIDRDTLRQRLLLCLFALGTNMGIKAIVATGEHGETGRPVRPIFACDFSPCTCSSRRWCTSTPCPCKPSWIHRRFTTGWAPTSGAG